MTSDEETESQSADQSDSVEEGQDQTKGDNKEEEEAVQEGAEGGKDNPDVKENGKILCQLGI